MIPPNLINDLYLYLVLGEIPSRGHDSPVSRSHSEESETARREILHPKLHLVSRRTKQFESGQLEAEEDRTPFYRSELSR